MSKRILSVLLAVCLFLPNALAYADQDGSETRFLDTSVTVPAHASDYSALLTRITPGSDFPQATEIEYKITYGATLSPTTDIKVEAQWYPGAITGGGTAEVLDYLPGSASNAYFNTAPVIDTLNHKISWSITNFPGATTGQVVTFKLKTNSDYTGSPIVSFDVAGRVYGPGVVTPDSIDTATYQYVSPPTPLSSSTPSTTTGTTPSPSITQAPAKLLIENVEVRSLTDSKASVFVATNNPAKITLSYGKTPSTLSKSVSTTGFSRFSNIRLEKLDPGTVYFFKLTATDQSSSNVTSDIYSFKTAAKSNPSEVDISTLIASSNDVILSLGTGSKTTNYLVIPEDTVFQIKFALKTRASGTKVQALIRGRNTLDSPGTETTDLVEVEPGVYTGKLKTKPDLGLFEIFARITDTKGNITEQKLADLKVVAKFKVLNKSDKKPIEGARVELFIYNPTDKKYIRIPSSTLLLGNPVLSGSKGQLNIALPQGKYKAVISDLYHKDQTVEFALGPKDKDYPTVLMEKENLTILKVIRYYSRTINEVFVSATQAYTKGLTGSTRFFDLVAMLTLASLVLLALIAFAKRHAIPLSSLTSHFFYLLDKKARNEKYILGVVYDQNDNAIPMSNVYLTDEETEEIIAHTKTDIKGEFFFKKNKGKFLLMVMKKGFRTTPLLRYVERDHVRFKISLQREEGIFDIFDHVKHFSEGLLGMSFEILLLISLLFELLFLNSFGVAKTIPFFAVSLFNLILWTLKIRHHRSI